MRMSCLHIKNRANLYSVVPSSRTAGSSDGGTTSVATGYLPKEVIRRTYKTYTTRGIVSEQNLVDGQLTPSSTSNSTQRWGAQAQTNPHLWDT